MTGTIYKARYTHRRVSDLYTHSSARDLTTRFVVVAAILQIFIFNLQSSLAHDQQYKIADANTFLIILDTVPMFKRAETAFSSGLGADKIWVCGPINCRFTRQKLRVPRRFFRPACQNVRVPCRKNLSCKRALFFCCQTCVMPLRI
jgi:hypothetical protein